jgi:hypothetical protein
MGYIFFSVFGLVAIAALVYSQMRSRRFSSVDWDTLVASIEPMHMRGLELVALDHLQPQGNQLRLEPCDLWGLVGGTEGLRRMEHNADRIIALAAYVRRWNYDQAIIVSERIRQDAVQMKRSVRRIRWELYFRRKQLRVPFYIHQAASSYYLMTKRLLALYESSQFVLYPKLAEVL